MQIIAYYANRNSNNIHKNKSLFVNDLENFLVHYDFAVIDSYDSGSNLEKLIRKASGMQHLPY